MVDIKITTPQKTSHSFIESTPSPRMLAYVANKALVGGMPSHHQSPTNVSAVILLLTIQHLVGWGSPV